MVDALPVKCWWVAVYSHFYFHLHHVNLPRWFFLIFVENITWKSLQKSKILYGNCNSLRNQWACRFSIGWTLSHGIYSFFRDVVCFVTLSSKLMIRIGVIDRTHSSSSILQFVSLWNKNVVKRFKNVDMNNVWLVLGTSINLCINKLLASFISNFLVAG